MLTQKDNLKAVDSEIYEIINAEEIRQQNTIDLIASENIASRAVIEAQGTVLTNKYAEGYPGKRYYAGCSIVDKVETLAIERAKALFQAKHANVQPHSGSQANMAVYFTIMKPGDTFMAMNLSHGGHLTHGSPVNFSGTLFNVVNYGVNIETGLIDLDNVAELAERHRPKLIVAGASAYSRIIDFRRFREIADSVNAVLMVDMAHIAGLVAAGIHPSPIPHAQFVTSTTHKTLRGPRGGIVLCDEEYGKELDRKVFPFMQGGPLMQVIAAKAVALKEAMSPEFRTYQAQVVKNAQELAKYLSERGFKIVSGGTDNHLFLLDLSGWEKTKDLDGLTVQLGLEKAGIIVSRTTVPGDTRKPYYGSGIRFGTPTVTTRNMKQKEMRIIGEYICEAIFNIKNEKILNSIRQKVEKLNKEFPLFQ